MVAMNLPRHVQAKTRMEKTLLVDSIVDQIREASPNGGFIKKDSDGHWYEVGTQMACEKVGHAFRDCMTAQLRNRARQSPQETRKHLQDAQMNIFRSLRMDLCRKDTTTATRESLHANTVEVSSS